MGEVQGAFAQILQSVGGTYDQDYERRVLALKVDGVPLSDIYADQRKPDSNFYGQGFVEGLSVARVLVPMNLDLTVVNIARRDAPDLRVDFSDRPPVFIEHSTVTPYDGMTFDRHLDDMNIAVRRRLGEDAAARAVNDAGYASVRLTDPGVGARSKPEVIASEVVALLPTLSDDIDHRRLDATTFPVLATYGANVFYRPGQVSNATICNQDAGCFDPTPAWVGQRLRAALQKKAGNAAKYAPDARPLWLLLTLEGEHLFAPFVADLVNAGLVGVSIFPFDRVVVWCVGCQPFVFGPA
jgi:hypothetical protein